MTLVAAAVAAAADNRRCSNLPAPINETRPTRISQRRQPKSPFQQLNDSFQFNRATVVTLEHKSTTEGATFDKEVSGYSSGQVRVEGKIDITSSLQIDTP